MSKKSDQWGTRVGLILAMAGNAVGLGNFLRFPVQAVQNGGGAFIIPYLVCFFIMGIPLLWIEWTMGRYGGRFGHHSTPFILDNMTKLRFWKYFGVFGIFTNVAVAAYYCYIESWTMSYIYHSLKQTFAGMDQSAVASFFNDYVTIGTTTTGIPYEAVVFYILCLALNTYILSKGLGGGIERVAKVGMPLLLIFGAFLAIKGVTLGSSGAPEGCTDCDTALALNFLWTPQFDSLLNPKVWLAAAGQIFFTLSVGMGTVHCYASYVRSKDDIALNAMSAGWMNEFTEIVLGASIVVPIAVGYLGLDWVKENIGFSVAFQVMPYLFGQWGSVLATLAGVAWFGVLFFAAITSSLAMGTPWVGFMKDEFNFSSRKAAFSFGGLIFIMGMPTVLFFQKGVFDEYDYWAGTVSLVVFALAETIIFSYRFGIDKGWEELTRGSDMKIPLIYKPIIKYITPLLLLVVFLSALVTPLNNDWKTALKGKWELDPSSIIGKIQNANVTANRAYFADYFESEVEGVVLEVTITDEGEKTIVIGQRANSTADANVKDDQSTSEELAQDDVETVIKTYNFDTKKEIIVKEGDKIAFREHIAKGNFINDIFYIDMSRLLLLCLFLFISYLVFMATKRREKLIKQNT